MRELAKALLRTAGLEVRRLKHTPRATMDGGLLWLSQQKIEIQTVLDVGASNGVWSRQCMRFFPKPKYVLFEPQPVHSAELDAFAGSNPSVSVVKKAVGAAEGHTFFDATAPTGGALQQEAGPSSIKVELTTIDASIARLEARGPYLLKLDTHGFEPGILEGAAGTLEKTEVLIIEAYCHRIAPGSFLFWELCAYLDQRGFRPVDIVDIMHRPYDRSLWQMDMIFIRSTWSGFNYIRYA